mmetsp:Transcript_69513/g.193401  ORF Transcript_69513/g.193401 Transcript_69513/m.193401 type:complete len:209 (-) Transcript_69513:159-785(-)
MPASADRRVASHGVRLGTQPRHHLQTQLPFLALLAGADRGAIREDVRHNALVQHRTQQPQSVVPTRAFFTCTDNSAVGDHVGFEAHSPHLPHQRQSKISLLTLLASADCGVVSRHPWLHATTRMPHFFQQCHRVLPTLRLLASADRGVVNNLVQLHLILMHPAQQTQRSVPLRGLFTRTDRGAEHGYRWFDHVHLSRPQQREHMRPNR